MSTVNIIIPVSEEDGYEAMSDYYANVLQFRLEDGLFFLPQTTQEIALRLMIVVEESRNECPPRRHFPIFCFKIENNFFSYVNMLFKRGANIEKVISHPGGYYALVSDPSTNQFEIECDSFDEENGNIDPFLWPFYKRY